MCALVTGVQTCALPISLPAVLGRDFSGVVEAVGAEVTGFMVGDAVFGQAAADAEGTFADYVSIPVDRAAKKPETISHIDAASRPNVLMAAWDGVFSTARGLDLQPGQDRKSEGWGKSVSERVDTGGRRKMKK